MGFKLILSDIDGTLLPAGKYYISKYSYDTIRRIQDMGILFAPASGRTTGMLKIGEEPLDFDYGIVMNGTTVYDYKNNKVLHRIYMPTKEVVEVIKELRKYPFIKYLCFIDDMLIKEPKFSKMASFPYKNTVIIVDDIVKKIEKENSEVTKISVDLPANKQKELSDYLRNKFTDLEFTSFNPTSIEIVPKNGNKGYATKKLCEYLNIPLDEVIVMGDSENDLEMLELGCFNIMPKNSNEELKKYAHVICDDCINDGPCKTLRQIFNIE